MRNSAPQGWLENPSFTHFSSKLTPSQRQQIPHHTYRQFKKSTVTQKEKAEAHACNPTDSAPSRCPTGNPPPPFLIFLVNVSFYFPLYITQIQMIIIKSAQLTLAKPTALWKKQNISALHPYDLFQGDFILHRTGGKFYFFVFQLDFWQEIKCRTVTPTNSLKTPPTPPVWIRLANIIYLAFLP